MIIFKLIVKFTNIKHGYYMRLNLKIRVLGSPASYAGDWGSILLGFVCCTIAANLVLNRGAKQMTLESALY